MTIAVRRPPVPGHSVWWLGGAMLGGLVWPPALAALLSLAAYYPVGAALAGPLMEIVGSSLGFLLAILALSAALLLAGAIYSLVTWSWRPLVLTLLFGFCACAGLLPGLYVGAGLKSWAFELFSRRSMVVVEAIERYAQANGKPPPSLADLVPGYLPTIPNTGMATYPVYEYEPSSGDCSAKNEWHLQVDVQEYIDMNRLLYCPAQDYEVMPRWLHARARIGAWAHDRIDF
jgi:hypothetical protein